MDDSDSHRHIMVVYYLRAAFTAYALTRDNTHTHTHTHTRALYCRQIHTLKHHTPVQQLHSHTHTHTHTQHMHQSQHSTCTILHHNFYHHHPHTHQCV
jgi:hypothetical protein